MPRFPVPLQLLARLGAVALAAVCAVTAQGSEPTTLGQPGYLVIAGARDTTAALFTWRDGPGPGRRALVWPEGTLSLPVDLAADAAGARDLGLACGPGLSGVGSSGHLVFRDGIFTVSEPLVLSDGVLELHVAAGEIEVRGARIVYRRPPGAPPREGNLRADMILLAGMVLLVVILMRRARRMARRQ